MEVGAGLGLVRGRVRSPTRAPHAGTSTLRCSASASTTGKLIGSTSRYGATGHRRRYAHSAAGVACTRGGARCARARELSHTHARPQFKCKTVFILNSALFKTHLFATGKLREAVSWRWTCTQHGKSIVDVRSPGVRARRDARGCCVFARATWSSPVLLNPPPPPPPHRPHPPTHPHAPTATVCVAQERDARGHPPRSGHQHV